MSCLIYNILNTIVTILFKDYLLGIIIFQPAVDFTSRIVCISLATLVPAFSMINVIYPLKSDTFQNCFDLFLIYLVKTPSLHLAIERQ